MGAAASFALKTAALGLGASIGLGTVWSLAESDLLSLALSLRWVYVPAMLRRLLVLLSAGLLLATPARAACDGPAPSFRHGVATAETLVVGEVTDAIPAADAGGFARAFTLRVDHVLRGTAPPVMELRDVVMQPCAGVILVQRGDVIAIAFGAREFDMDVNAVAYLRGVPYRDDIERLTREELFSLVGLPSPTDPNPLSSIPWGLGLAAALLGAVALVAFRDSSRFVGRS